MRQRRGYLRMGNYEADCLTCAHCQFQIVVKTEAATQQLHRCGQCHATICPKCADELTRTLKCAPWEKRLEAIEASERLVKAAAR